MVRKTKKRGSGFMSLFRRKPKQTRIHVAPIQHQNTNTNRNIQRVLPSIEEIQERHNIYIEPKELEGEIIEEAKAEITAVPKGKYNPISDVYDIEMFPQNRETKALALNMLDVYNPTPSVLTKKKGGKRRKRRSRRSNKRN